MPTNAPGKTQFIIYPSHDELGLIKKAVPYSKASSASGFIVDAATTEAKQLLLQHHDLSAFSKEELKQLIQEAQAALEASP